ncbi:response regulator [Cupriavidus sp. WKF15]|uniref:response regulator transcription factor n=1 Tax=Cupriavidus sp. WKF15 TaxID=3032282 RepID=UPI0023E21B29|nr:response regulator [Cupriavidus sp. WKF15]WER47519.1 response regulator [Cupriavidus sp. WKF15]
MTAIPVIAIVDDDASVRDAMGRLVRSCDFAAELFGGGGELLQSGKLHQIACVITDVVMPGMNGFALYEQLRASGFDKPVIFMTGFAEEGSEQRAMAAGAACFLKKPFQDTDIIRCIEQALQASAGDSSS